MLRILFYFFLLVSLGTTATAQQNAQALAYEAYLRSDLDTWQDAYEQMTRAYEQNPNPALQLRLAKTAYGAISACFADEDMDAAADWVKLAEKHTDALLDAQPEHAEAKALLAGIYGMKIALKPIKGMVLGGRASRLLDEALAADPNCALAYYHRGTSAYNTPEQWGGSKEAALTAFQSARTHYETGNLKQNWEYLNTLAWLGINQHALGNYQEAQAVYQTALEVAPDFGWVKFVLLAKTEEVLADKN